MRTKYIGIFLIFVSLLAFVGCTQSSKVSHNLSKQADNFNVTRMLTVVNTRTDTIIFQMTGNFSIEKASDGDLEITGENDNGEYYKHFVNLSRDITYVVEDIDSTGVDKHKYEINFNPDMIMPFAPTIVD